jgi:hypothetical protein
MTLENPYHVYGIVSDGGTPSNNAKVYAKDITLGSSIISVTTGSNGRYILDLSSIANDGDTISVWCFSSDGKYKSISFTLDISGADEQQNLAVV